MNTLPTTFFEDYRHDIPAGTLPDDPRAVSLTRRNTLGLATVSTSIAKLLCHLLLFFATLGMFSSPGLAKDIFIAQIAAGNATGVGCANALPYTFFNTAANWGTGAIQIAPGTTVHLCGVISAQLTARGSGSSGLPITIMFEPGAKISLPLCDGYGCLSLAASSYITVDGGASGVIENTANGTGVGLVTAIGNGHGGSKYQTNDVLTLPGGNGGAQVRVTSADGTCAGLIPWQGGTGYTTSPGVFATGGHGSGCTVPVTSVTTTGYANSSPSVGLLFTGHDVTVKNLTIQNMYVNTNVLDSTGAFGISSAAIKNPSGPLNNVMLQNNTIHDCRWCISLGNATNGNGLTISGNTVYNADHGIALTSSGGALLSGVNIYGNLIYGFTAWNSTAGNYHHDAIHLWGATEGTFSGVSIYSNRLLNAANTYMTGLFFVESTVITDLTLFNNIFNSQYRMNGLIQITSSVNNLAILNNTIISGPPKDGASGVCVSVVFANGFTMENNVLSTCGQELAVNSSNVYTSTGLAYNIYSNLLSGNGWCIVNVCRGTLAAWQLLTGQDMTSRYYMNSLLTSDGLPQSGSPVIGAGANLTSLCTGNMGPLCKDYTGNRRPATGPWGVGAYQFTAAPRAPTSLSVTGIH